MKVNVYNIVPEKKPKWTLFIIYIVTSKTYFFIYVIQIKFSKKSTFPLLQIICLNFVVSRDSMCNSRAVYWKSSLSSCVNIMLYIILHSVNANLTSLL